MAGVFERVKDLIDQNVNSLLDKAEDPEKAADQMVRQYKEAMKDLKTASTKVIAEEKLAKSKLDDCDGEINKYTGYARKAVADGNDEMAKKALQRKKEQEVVRETLASNYQRAHNQAEKARNDYQKLANSVGAIEARAAQIKSNAVAAKATKMSASAKAGASVDGVMDKLSRAEEKSKRMLAEAEANAELSGSSSIDDELDSLYGGASVSDVDGELDALKKEMGMAPEKEVETSVSLDDELGGDIDDELEKMKQELGV